MRIRIALVGLLYAACAAGDQTVVVGPGLSFSPSNVTVAPGEKITWVWTGYFHSSTSDATTGPEVWDSGIINTGSFDHVFTTPGSYPYYCKVHSFPGGTAMNGSVQVIEPVTPTPTATPVPNSSPTATPATTPTPSSGAVPTLGAAGKLALALGLIVAAWILFFFSRSH